MVKFESLGNTPNERAVRYVVSSPTGTIKIFEPSKEDISRILSLQDFITNLNQDVEEGDQHMLDISGLTIMRDLIPMLTDIEFDEDMTDEELEKIINNPTVALMEVTKVLTGIMVSVYKMMILEAQNHLIENDMALETAKTENQAAERLMQMASLTDEGREMVKQINVDQSKLDNVVELGEFRKEDVEDVLAEAGLEPTPIADVIKEELPESSKPNDYQDRLYEEKVAAHYKDFL